MLDDMSLPGRDPAGTALSSSLLAPGYLFVLCICCLNVVSQKLRIKSQCQLPTSCASVGGLCFETTKELLKNISFRPWSLFLWRLPRYSGIVKPVITWCIFCHGTSNVRAMVYTVQLTFCVDYNVAAHCCMHESGWTIKGGNVQL